MSTLAVLVQYATDLPDVESFGKQDPYCVLDIGGQRQTTKVHKDGGKRPIWNEEVRFTNPVGDVLNITILDKETLGKDENIGFAAVSLTTIRNGGTQPVVAPVTTTKRSSGQIHLTLTWYGPPMGGAHNAPYGAVPGHGHQQPGYPPQSGYPPQAGYPPQHGYQPQPGYPPQAGYPQHGAPMQQYAQQYAAPCPGHPPHGQPPPYGAPGGYAPQYPGAPPGYGGAR